MIIKWLVGLVVKSNKPIKDQVAEARERLFSQQYEEGKAFAERIWATSPEPIARMCLLNKAGSVSTYYELAIWEFLKSRYP